MINVSFSNFNLPKTWRWFWTGHVHTFEGKTHRKYRGRSMVCVRISFAPQEFSHGFPLTSEAKFMFPGTLQKSSGFKLWLKAEDECNFWWQPRWVFCTGRVTPPIRHTIYHSLPQNACSMRGTPYYSINQRQKDIYNDSAGYLIVNKWI